MTLIIWQTHYALSSSKGQGVYSGTLLILSRASEVGSPKNRLGSGLRRDTEQWPLKFKKIRANFRPVLPRQGQPGTPHYVCQFWLAFLFCLSGSVPLSYPPLLSLSLMWRHKQCLESGSETWPSSRGSPWLESRPVQPRPKLSALSLTL